MSYLPAHYRDAGREALPGVRVPRMVIELDHPSGISVSPNDLRVQGGATIAGRVNINPSSTLWHDGTSFKLCAVSLAVRSSDGRYKDASSSLSPSTSNAIKIGSSPQTLSGTSMAIWSFIIRIPPSALSSSTSTSFSIHATAGFAQDSRVSPNSVLAPAAMQIHANPMVKQMTLKGTQPYPLSPPHSP